MNVSLPSEISDAARRIREALAREIEKERAVSALARLLHSWRSADFPPRQRVTIGISDALGFSVPMLTESLDALLAPFTTDVIADFASIAANRRELIGLIAPGNVAGAGLHEIIISLLAGAGLLIKTSSREPRFFAELALSLAVIDPALAARVAVFNFSRADTEATAAMLRECDRVIALGDDATITALGGNVLGFGSRASGAIVARAALLSGAAKVAAQIARDVSLFEQLGCLSPHHVFVEGQPFVDEERPGLAREFAVSLGCALGGVLRELPSPTLSLEDAAALRRARETARWRAIAGDPVELLEGDLLSWTVIYDRDAQFTPSPGFRTLTVSPFGSREDLRSRLMPAAGRLEAFAIAGDDESKYHALLSELGVTYVARTGDIQSPPLTWRHGGGAFLDSMTWRGVGKPASEKSR